MSSPIEVSLELGAIHPQVDLVAVLTGAIRTAFVVVVVVGGGVHVLSAHALVTEGLSSTWCRSKTVSKGPPVPHSSV